MTRFAPGVETLSFASARHASFARIALAIMTTGYARQHCRHRHIHEAAALGLLDKATGRLHCSYSIYQLILPAATLGLPESLLLADDFVKP